MIDQYMLDLETGGVNPDAPILSIGANKFDINTGEVLEKFYQVVDLFSCIKAGMTIEPGTFYWWLSDSVTQDARNAVLDKENSISIEEACHKFGSWIEDTCTDKRKAWLWGNGSGFDNVIIRNAFKRVGIQFPLGYGRDRDVRTIVDLAKTMTGGFEKGERGGTYHNALDDSIYQTGYVSKAYAIVRGFNER